MRAEAGPVRDATGTEAMTDATQIGRQVLPASARWVERAVFAALILVVALAPLPFGSDRPLPAALLAFAVGLLLMGWSLTFLLSRDRRLPVPLSRIGWPLALYAVVCLWILIQWSPGMFSGVSDPIWREAARLLDMDVDARISVAPEATITGLMHLLTYAGVFWLSLQFNREPDRTRLSIRAVAAIGTLYALYGLGVFLSGNESILIYRKWVYADSLSSTFVNRNSYATFAGLTLLCAVTVLIDRLRHLLSLERPLRIKVAMIIEELAARSAWTTVFVLAISLALVFSTSRAGVVSSMCGLILLLAIQAARRALSKTQMALMAAVALLLALATFVASGHRLSDRLAAENVGESFEQRNAVYATTLDAIESSPWTGTGFGTFADVFPAYRSDSLYNVYWDKAHNTYLENALELGVPAAVLLNLAIFLLAFRTARGVAIRRREKGWPAIGLAATVIVALHSYVDFSLEIPAVAILYAFLLGLSVSQSWPAAARQ